ncbi:hypothetical protein IL306_003653 [Fusarium sp. DS 682]|nr:hypothetical protein IL306_003653 [Fusarium sp. DS 682]
MATAIVATPPATSQVMAPSHKDQEGPSNVDKALDLVFSWLNPSNYPDLSCTKFPVKVVEEGLFEISYPYPTPLTSPLGTDTPTHQSPSWGFLNTNSFLSTRQPTRALAGPSDVSPAESSSGNETTHTPFERPPKGLGTDRSSISILSFEARRRILSFCTDPRDLMALVLSSSVFLVPFCANRLSILGGVVKDMRFRFGGDMPINCMMAARLRSIRSQWKFDYTRVLEDSNKAAIERTFKGSCKGPMLHPSYSLRAFGFISEILVEAEGLMISYSCRAWNLSSALHEGQELVLSATEKKRFLDAICLFEAYCTAFFFGNGVLFEEDSGLRQRFFEDYDGPEKNISRFYSIFYYLWDFYRFHLQIDGKHDQSSSLPSYVEATGGLGQPYLLTQSGDRLGQAVEAALCKGLQFFHELQQMETQAEIRQFLDKHVKDSSTHSVFSNIKAECAYRWNPWAYIDMTGLTQTQIHTADRFWDRSRRKNRTLSIRFRAALR